MMRSLTLALLTVLGLTFVACGYDQGYDRGYGAGHADGYRSGFQAARPTPNLPPSNGLRRAFNASLPWLAFIFVTVNLLLLLRGTIWTSSNWGERFGRGMVVFIPPITLYWATDNYQATVKIALFDMLLQPRTSEFSGRLSLFLLAAALVIVPLFLLWKLCERLDGQLMHSLLVLAIASILSLLAPALWSLVSVPAVAGYKLMDVVAGLTVGGIVILSMILTSGTLRFNGPLSIIDALFRRLTEREPPNQGHAGDG